MNYTIRSVLTDRENKNGLRLVKIVVTVGGVRTYITTGIKVKETEFKDGEVINHASAKSYNSTIRKKFVETEEKILAQLREGELNIKTFQKQKDYQVIIYFEKLIKELETKYRAGTIRIYYVQLRKLKAFDPQATFNSINAGWLRRYEDHLRTTLSNNSVHGCFKVLKKVFNSAIADGITKNYPFAKYDNPKYREPDRLYLTEKEIQAFEKALNKPLDDTVRLCGKYFLLGCYSGLRVSDWLRFNKSFIQGDRLILRAKKNGELVSMKMHTKLKALVKELLTLPKPPTEQKINQYIKIVAGHAKIKKNIHTHSARHSYAVRCAELGISIESTAELMGITIAVCGVYYKVTANKLDKETAKWH